MKNETTSDATTSETVIPLAIPAEAVQAPATPVVPKKKFEVIQITGPGMVPAPVEIKEVEPNPREDLRKSGLAKLTAEEKSSLQLEDDFSDYHLNVQVGRGNTAYFTGVEWPDEDDLVKPINNIIRGDGVWQIRKNGIGLFAVKLVDQKFTGYPKKEDNKPFFMPWHGKIPHNLLQEIVYFFKAICDESKDEVYVQIFWDPKEEIYFNFCPVQEVSGGRVSYKRDEQMERDYVLCAEIHSHNTMSAQFSSIDDEDEKNDRFYGVIGHLDHLKPAITMSYVCGGKRQHIGVHHLFTEAPAEEQLFPQEWRKRITRSGGAVHHGGQGSYNPQNWPNRSSGSEYSSTSSGAYRHQNTRVVRDEQEATSQGSEGRATIESRIEKATKEAQARLEEIGSTTDGKASESGVSATSPFFHPTSRSGASATRDEHDEELVMAVNLVEETLLHHYAKEIEMKDEEKHELFNSLVAGMNVDDVAILLDAVSANGHFDLLQEQVGLYDSEADAKADFDDRGSTNDTAMDLGTASRDDSGDERSRRRKGGE